MAWIKRNLGLVIGAAVAFALMVVAGFYLWTRMQEDALVTQQLDETMQQFTTVLTRPLHPGVDGGRVNNIELAKEENKRLQTFLEDVRSRFGKREIPTNITARD